MKSESDMVLNFQTRPLSHTQIEQMRCKWGVSNIPLTLAALSVLCLFALIAAQAQLSWPQSRAAKEVAEDKDGQEAAEENKKKNKWKKKQKNNWPCMPRM